MKNMGQILLTSVLNAPASTLNPISRTKKIFLISSSCITCDMLWEDHDMVYETEDERKLLKKPIGKDFYPLAKFEDIQKMVFSNKESKVDPGEYVRPKPVQKTLSIMDKSGTTQTKTIIATKPVPKDLKSQEEEKSEKIVIKGNTLKLKTGTETSKTLDPRNDKLTIQRGEYLNPTSTTKKTSKLVVDKKNMQTK